MFSAAAGEGAEFESTGYRSVWVRDNVHIAHAHWVWGERDKAIAAMTALMSFFVRHRHRFTDAIAGRSHVQDPMQRPHIRFDGERLIELDEKWSHAQNDALGGFLWLYSKLAAAGDCSFPKGQVLYKELLASEFMDLFVTTYGINEALAPRVGIAMVNVGDAPTALNTRTEGGEQWNMHWAGIIMTDGNDYVALENFALEMDEITAEDLAPNADFLNAIFNSDGSVKDYELIPKSIASDKTDLINEKWVYNIYGKASDSFHKVAGGGKKATPVNMSLPVTRRV